MHLYMYIRSRVLCVRMHERANMHFNFSRIAECTNMELGTTDDLPGISVIMKFVTS